MCEPTTIAAIGTYIGSAASTVGSYAGVATAAVGAASAYQSARTNKAVAENNAATAELKAQDALRRGQEQRQEIQRRGMILQGQQRAALSARGLDLSAGTPSDILASTEFFTEADSATAVTNSRREAWSNRAQRAGFQAQADGISPGLTLLAGAGSVADKWHQLSKPNGWDPDGSYSRKYRAGAGM